MTILLHRNSSMKYEHQAKNTKNAIDMKAFVSLSFTRLFIYYELIWLFKLSLIDKLVLKMLDQQMFDHVFGKCLCTSFYMKL